MLADALQAEVDVYIPAHAAEWTKMAAACWSVMATPAAGGHQPARMRLR